MVKYCHRWLVEKTISEQIEFCHLNRLSSSMVIKKYQLPVESETTLKVYDMFGNEIAILVNEIQAAGNYDVKFNTGNLACGIYLYTLQAGNFTITRKMILQ